MPIVAIGLPELLILTVIAFLWLLPIALMVLGIAALVKYLRKPKPDERPALDSPNTQE